MQITTTLAPLPPHTHLFLSAKKIDPTRDPTLSFWKARTNPKNKTQKTKENGR